MSNIHTEIVRNKSPFSQMVIAAWVIGVGDILCVLADIYWLFGDMSVQIHSHHYVVLVTLLLALVLIAGSFIWLYLGVTKYLRRHEHVHTKYERLVGEIATLKDEVKKLEFLVNTDLQARLAGLHNNEEK